jgi:uncharacterized surface protein with fasciclin (FAS1) repeats
MLLFINQLFFGDDKYGVCKSWNYQDKQYAVFYSCICRKQNYTIMKKFMSFALMIALFATSAFTLNKNANTINADADIVDLAIQTEFLSTLVAAVKAGDLVDVLKGDGPFTVFAPTNDAFAKLPAGTVETLLKPENKAQLVAVLTYHVVAGKVYSKDLSDGMTAKTVQGADVKISLKDGKAMVNNATVTTADIEATNGIVHVIDTVILPPM